MQLDPCPLPSSYTDNRHSSALPLSEAPKHPQIHPSLGREHRCGGGREWGSLLLSSEFSGGSQCY